MANLNYYGINLQLEYSVDTIAQRDAIPVDPGYREIGTRCYVQSTGIIYQLIGGITNLDWVNVSGSSIPNVGTTHEVWVDYSSTQTQITGAQQFPFHTLDAAITYANALAVSQPLTGIIINIEPLPAGGVINPIILPQNITVVLRSGLHNYPVLGDITINVPNGGISGLSLSNIAVGNITINDAGIGAGTCYIFSNLSYIQSITQNIASLSQVIVQMGGDVPPSETLWIPRSIVGSMVCNSSSLFGCYSTAIQGNISAGFININNSQISGNIFGYSAVGGIFINKSLFTGSWTIGYNDAAFVIRMDSSTWDSFRTNSCFLDNTYDNIIAMDSNLSTTVNFNSGVPASIGSNNGLLYSWFGTNTVEFAQAALGSTQKLAGVFVGDNNSILTTLGRYVPIRMEAGLSMVINDPIYVSSTNPGFGTNVKPPIGLFCGYIVDFGTYTSLTGGYVYAYLNPSSNHQNTEQVMISSLNAGGIWFPLEFVGPTFAQSSNPSLTGFGIGVGFARITKPGILKIFKWTNATPPASPIDIQLWKSSLGNPSLIQFTGIMMTMQAGDYISTNNIDQLAVAEDDIIIFYNNSFIGYTPDAMTITCDLISS